MNTETGDNLSDNAAPEKKDFVSWLKNYWYYYKFHTFAAVLIILVVVLSIHSCVTKKEVDAYIYVITENPIVFNEESVGLKNTLYKYAPDFNNDGETLIEVKNLYISDSEDYNLAKENREELRNAFQAGAMMLVLADDYGIEFLKRNSYLNNISDITSSAEYEGLAWNAKDSEFMKYDEMKFWEGNLYFGLRNYNENSIINIKKDASDKYAYAENMLRNIINQSPVNQ